MPLSVEDLLKPRYKLIADYPDSPYSVGQILLFSRWGGDLKLWANYNDEGGFVGYTDYFDEYPHLFKKLEWWEDRKMEEMPEYFKVGDIGADIGESAVYKIGVDAEWNYYDNNTIGVKYKSDSGTLVDYVIPVTEAEYNAYINKQ